MDMWVMVSLGEMGVASPGEVGVVIPDDVVK